MTDVEMKDIWASDVLRGTFSLNHFLYCYIQPQNVRVLCLGIRLSVAFDATGACRYDCPMLNKTWEGNIADTDFRPDIAREILHGIGLKRDKKRECYKICPYSLVIAGLPYITFHANDMSLDLSDAYWLPPVDVSWKRELRAR